MKSAFQPREEVLRAAVRENRPPHTPRGPVWVSSNPSVSHVALRRALRDVPVYHGARPQGHVPPTLAICHPEGGEDLASALAALAQDAPGASVVVFGASADLPLARAALRAGARGFLHVRMPPEHIARALHLAEQGEVVLPKDLLGALTEEARGPDLSALTARQMEILKLIAEGLANAQVAERLYISESTVKQHLRAAYRLLGVKNRVQATAALRRAYPVLRGD